MTSDKKTGAKRKRVQKPGSKAAYHEMRKAVERAYAETGAAREFGISVPREHYIHDQYKIDDPNYWRDLSIAMVDSFEKDPGKLARYNETLATLADAVKSPPEYMSVGQEETVDKFDPLFHIMAFIFGVAAVTAPNQVSNRDVRRVMASVNSVKRSMLQYRKNSANRSEEERKQRALYRIRRADVRKAAQYAVENDIDPFELGLITDPQVVDTVTEMYRIMKMQRNQARGQNALATARLELYRKRVTKLVSEYRMLLKKTKGPVTANNWREEKLKEFKKEDKELVAQRKIDIWNEKHPRSKKHRDKSDAASTEAKASTSTSDEKEELTEEDKKLMAEFGIPIDDE